MIDDAGATLKACPDCAERVRQEANACRFCGFRFDAVDRRVTSPKSVPGAVLLGLLLSGLGHFYVGEGQRGAAILGTAILGAVAVAIAVEPPGPVLVPLTAIVVSAVDAYRAAVIYNDGGAPRKPTGGIWALVALGVIGLAVAA